MTSTTLSVGFAPFTLAASLLGLGLFGPRIHNASKKRKKRVIIESHLQPLEFTHHTHQRDVLGPMALSSTIGGLTLDLAPAGADAVMSVGAEHAIAAIASNPDTVVVATHAALDGVRGGVEHAHAKKTQKKEWKKMEREQEAVLRQFKSWKAEEEAETESLPSYTEERPQLEKSQNGEMKVEDGESDVSGEEEMTFEDFMEMQRMWMEAKAKSKPFYASSDLN